MPKENHGSKWKQKRLRNESAHGEVLRCPVQGLYLVLHHINGKGIFSNILFRK